MPMFTKGFVLDQRKEPAFSKPIVRFTNPQEPMLDSAVIPNLDVNRLTPEQLIELARAAQIVDERDGKMLYRKLTRVKGKAVAVIADAIDDEPYVSSQIAPMLRLKDEAVGGLRLCERVAQSKNVLVLTYRNITDVFTRIPKQLDEFRIIKLHGGYPAEPRLNSLDLPEGPKLVVGAGALIHFYRAVTQHVIHSSAFVTVAGNCVANPMNLEVSLGMTVSQVLERCGMTAQPTRVILGGPMTGISVLDTDSTVVTPTTRAILAFRDNERDAYYTCIGCGRCEQVCPQDLNPVHICRLVKNNYFTYLEPFDAHLCSGCGICSYICPSRLNVAGTVDIARRYALEHFITPSAEEENDFEV